MSNTFFNIFPNENFIDLCMYQFGYEQCDPGHSFGPATRNHYLFHYVLSGTGTLMADNAKGETQTYSVKSGQGFMIFPGQINTYIADEQLPWEYMWIEFDGLRVKEALSVTDLCKDAPVYHSHSKELREKLADEMLYIVNHPQESSFHLIGHLYLFLDYLLQSAKSATLISSGRMSDYYIKEAINYMEQNFQNTISIEDIAESYELTELPMACHIPMGLSGSEQEIILLRIDKGYSFLELAEHFGISEMACRQRLSRALHKCRTLLEEPLGSTPK